MRWANEINAQLVWRKENPFGDELFGVANDEDLSTVA